MQSSNTFYYKKEHKRFLRGKNFIQALTYVRICAAKERTTTFTKVCLGRQISDNSEHI